MLAYYIKTHHILLQDVHFAELSISDFYDFITWTRLLCTHTSHRERICLCENVCCLEPHKRWIHFEWKEINSFMQPTSKTIHTSANFLLTTTNWLDNWFGFVYSPADIAHCSLCACVRVFSIVSLALHSYYLEFFIRALKTLLERARASIQTHT